MVNKLEGSSRSRHHSASTRKTKAKFQTVYVHSTVVVFFSKMYLPSIVATIHFVFFFVPFASALLMSVVRSSSVSNAKRGFSGCFVSGRHSGGFVTLSCSFSIVFTQLSISSSLILSFVLVISSSVISSYKQIGCTHINVNLWNSLS